MPTKAPTHLSASSKRPPVVVIMGHIDHGKSTLLDYIRKTNIVAKEAGGITQHLGAYEVPHDESTITFLDTPGHEAFSSIRERGSKVADVAVLVVSAEDGVKPQTVEALKCILDEKIPYIVAVNKIDKPGADVEKTKASLAEHEIYVEGYGGDVPIIPISALTGKGIPDLLDMIILVTDLQDLKANRDTSAEGTIIEAGLDNQKGIHATLLIKNGTLKIGSYVVTEDAYAPVRILENFLGKAMKSASFSSPVRITGFNKIPHVGAAFTVIENRKEAEEMAASFKSAPKKAFTTRKTTDTDGAGITIPLVIKADAIGSLEGIEHELAKIDNPKVYVKIVAQSVGNINEGDLKTAQSNPDIIILAFNSKPDAKAKGILERTAIKVESFDVIYNLIEFVKNLVISKVPREYVDEPSGLAKILAVFSKTKEKQIVGGKVQQGSILVGSEVKILRREAEIGRGKVRELQQSKARTEEVREGFEFGTMIETKIEIAIGDKIQGFRTVEKK